jgi:Flp pilus assembly protein TadB
MSTPRRRLRWATPKSPAPAHPYRDSAILYAVLAVILVLIAVLFGSNVVKATIIALFCFVAATTWSMIQWRRVLREEERKRGWEES